ncbi:MAG: cytoplasmic protein [Desulfobacteraceae bacterium]|nr:MAG: cytoplasmic protein [Desulfobacteraceae bacterium]
MAKKVVLVAFNGEPMCFVHVLLNALDMEEKGYEVKLVIEGSATRLVNELNDEAKPFGKLYMDVRRKGIIDCVCQACAAKMEALDGAKAQGLPLCSEMKGHPALAKYMEQGYEVITF